MKSLQPILWEIRRINGRILVRLQCGCRVRIPSCDTLPKMAECNADHTSKRLLRA
jgi:hypothetical protein